MEIKILTFNPTTDNTKFVSDIYVNGRRVICGQGSMDRTESIKSAVQQLIELASNENFDHIKLFGQYDKLPFKESIAYKEIGHLPVILDDSLENLRQSKQYEPIGLNVPLPDFGERKKLDPELLKKIEGVKP